MNWSETGTNIRAMENIIQMKQAWIRLNSVRAKVRNWQTRIISYTTNIVVTVILFRINNVLKLGSDMSIFSSIQKPGSISLMSDCGGRGSHCSEAFGSNAFLIGNIHLLITIKRWMAIFTTNLIDDSWSLRGKRLTIINRSTLMKRRDYEYYLLADSKNLHDWMKHDHVHEQQQMQLQ